MTIVEYREWLKERIERTEIDLTMATGTSRDILLWVKHEERECLDKLNEVEE